jgi:hypothetical protein
VSTLADALLEAVGSKALETARARGLRVVVKTSITPAVTVYDARDVAPGVLEALGVKTHVIAIDDAGRVVAELGEPAPTDYPTAAAIWLLAAVAGFLVVVLAARALR